MKKAPKRIQKMGTRLGLRNSAIPKRVGDQCDATEQQYSTEDDHEDFPNSDNDPVTHIVEMSIAPGKRTLSLS